MWLSDLIGIHIEAVERSEVLVTVEMPLGTLEILGEITLVSGVLRIDRAHVQGLAPGLLGRAGLNAIGRKILGETGASARVVQGSTRSTGRNPDRAPYPIRFPR